jgi:hypothetical protein
MNKILIPYYKIILIKKFKLLNFFNKTLPFSQSIRKSGSFVKKESVEKKINIHLLLNSVRAAAYLKP